jgi:divalent metal cation (Fe/Co/Zn/Cd) transporter
VAEIFHTPATVPLVHSCAGDQCACVHDASVETRARLARRGRRLETFTIVWAAMEAGVALAGAHREHSISLAGFGWDSCIEMLSGAALYWRMTHEMDHAEKHRAEELSLKIAGFCLYALAAYVLVESVLELRQGGDHSPGWMGMAITTAALLTMPVLTVYKRRVAVGLNSRAMMTDAAQTNFCAIQAAIVLAGLAIRSIFHVGWADAVAGLVLVPFLIRAARAAFKGEACCTH